MNGNHILKWQTLIVIEIMWQAAVNRMANHGHLAETQSAYQIVGK